MEYLSPFLLSVVSSISTVGILAFVGYIFRSWIVERLKASIKHEYDLRMLEIESQREVRLKGEIVAELLAEWIKKNGSHDYHQLNRLSFQAYLWLPKELAEDLSNSLAHKQGAKDVRLLLKEIRTYLQGEDDGLASWHVIVFDEPDIRGLSFSSSQITSDAKVKKRPQL
ncbi:hypothetical protein ACFOEE_08480 [Pseudoalteromonas fenneropenaei]|uniref:Uncharacterized protein n=1 Tax=Pseudoalteromonas fenneropenaei TaxID=1737459 RepID=A0ABV7CIX1_9GAMM